MYTDGAALRLAETGSAPLASSPANPLPGKFSVALDPIPNHKMPQFMCNDPQCLVAIREYPGNPVAREWAPECYTLATWGCCEDFQFSSAHLSFWRV